ncbi:MAG: hypothetical protein AB1540_01815 [Bdellovibrionota bacterium]
MSSDDSLVTITSVPCDGATSFRLNADPILQANCLTCHTSGGAGSGRYQIVTSAGAEGAISENYSISRLKLDNSDADQTTFLLRPLGNSHPTIFGGTTEASYRALRQWVLDDLGTTCQ